MVDLAKLFAESRAKKEQGNATDETPTQTGTTRATTAGGGLRSVGSDIPAANEPSAPPTAGSEAPKGNPFARKAAAAAAQNPQSESAPQPSAESVQAEDRPDVQPRPRLAGFRFNQPATSAAPITGGGGVVVHSENGIQPVRPSVDLSLDSLADLEALEDPGVAPRSSTRSSFADETPATAPTRELPEGLEKQQLQFVDLMDGVYSILHDPELMGNVIKSIMIELKSQPQYIKLIAPDDVRLWVRGMRDHMGVARVKKQESKAKRNGAGSKASKLVDADMLADLADLGITGLE